jgi:putative transcriptional regulator
MKAKNRIRVVLADKEMKVQDFAAGVGASPVTASRWVNNRQQPSLDTLYEIADFLKVDICELLEKNEIEESE